MDNIILITGASGGIGAAVARLAARQGYSLCLHYGSNESAALALRDELADGGARVIARQADLREETAVVGLFADVAQHLGQVSVLINNAGVVAPSMPIEDYSAQRIRDVFEVNVLGSFLCSREAVRQMAFRHGGRGGAIVNVSSAAARLGSPHEYLDYAASKGAIDTFTQGLAKEVADQGIRVNAVRPGLIDTPIHAKGGDSGRAERLHKSIPMQRVGSADEVAEAIMWLAGDGAGYVTGALLDVSGGR